MAIVNNRNKIILLFLISLALILGIWRLFIDQDISKNNIPVSKTQDQTVITEKTKTVQEVEIVSDPKVSDKKVRLESSKSQSPFLTVNVQEKETGKPIEVFDFKLSKFDDIAWRWKTIVHETVRNRDGLFTCPLLVDGRLYLNVGTSRHVRFKKTIFEDYKITDGSQHIEIVLDKGIEVTGLVVEHATDKPVQGALVVESNKSIVRPDLFSKFPHSCIHAWTDNNGVFILKGLDKSKRRIRGQLLAKNFSFYAIHPDFAEGAARYLTEEIKDVKIRLKKGYRVYGKVLDDKTMQPLKGVCISVKSKKTSFCRYVLTKEDGSYRSAPTHQGELIVKASPSDGVAFIEVTKKAEIINKDIEVSFGNTTEKLVIWKGKVLDRDGQPMKSAKLKLQLKAILVKTDLIVSNDYKGTCNKDGCFELPKLLPGRYDVDVWCPEFAEYLNWGEVVFDKPGLFEKDLPFIGRGAVVSGVVVVAPGAKLPEDTDISVLAYNFEKSTQQETQLNLDDSTFYFPYLPSGTYSFYCRYCDPAHLVKLNDGQVVDNLRLVAYPKGELRIFLEGFTDEELKNLVVTIDSIEGQERSFPVNEKEHKWTLNEGDYILYLGKQEQSCLNRKFHITLGATTDLVFHADELINLSPLTIKGSLKDSSGAPIPGAYLGFSTRHHVYRTSHEITCKTDKNGLFVSTNMRPGRWSVRCRIELPEFGQKSTLSTYIYGLVIPEIVDSSFSLDLVLSSCAIVGRIIDGESGMPINGDLDPWRVLIGDANMRWMGELYGKMGSVFEINHVSSGEYIICVQVPGYKQYVSKQVSVAEGRIVDLGDIRLTGCGILLLEVKSISGEPLRFEATCNRERMGGHSGNQMTLSKGKILFTDLTLGETIIEVKSHGYKTEQYKVNLLPAQKVTLQAKLRPSK